MFAAPLFKPEDDPRSRLQFGTDNFKDNIVIMLNNVFATLLQPVFQVFHLFMDAIVQSLNGLFNVKALLSNMWNKWNEMTDIFTRRFHAVFHQFRLTFTKIYNSLLKSYGVAVSSLFAGLSTIHAMTSFVDLIIKIVITILVILVVMVILLFFVLAPVIPLILTVIGIIGATTFGGAVGGMASAFCFAKNTKVLTISGVVPIQDVELNTQISQHNRVVGVMKFATENYDMYDIDGIHVAGSHIVYYEGKPILSKNHPYAKQISTDKQELYCLITSTHTIPIVGNKGIYTFADWEEIETIDDLSDWYKNVFKSLNGFEPKKVVDNTILRSESALAPGTLVCTPDGFKAVHYLIPGDIILNSDKKPQKVLGTVILDPSQVQVSSIIDGNCISNGTWIKLDDIWTHPTKKTNTIVKQWYQLFTEDGTVTLANNVLIRDYSDIGWSEIHKTYAHILNKLT
jgi:hypothetical protein